MTPCRGRCRAGAGFRKGPSFRGIIFFPLVSFFFLKEKRCFAVVHCRELRGFFFPPRQKLGLGRVFPGVWPYRRRRDGLAVHLSFVHGICFFFRIERRRPNHRSRASFARAPPPGKDPPQKVFHDHFVPRLIQRDFRCSLFSSWRHSFFDGGAVIPQFGAPQAGSGAGLNNFPPFAGHSPSP